MRPERGWPTSQKTTPLSTAGVMPIRQLQSHHYPQIPVPGGMCCGGGCTSVTIIRSADPCLESELTPLQTLHRVPTQGSGNALPSSDYTTCLGIGTWGHCSTQTGRVERMTRNRLLAGKGIIGQEDGRWCVPERQMPILMGAVCSSAWQGSVGRDLSGRL
jgi:hypothetical protein